VDTLPGSLMRYSGGGTTVMQLMVEDVTGRPFPAYMRETVLQPLGMIHSSYDYNVSAERAARVARAHLRDGTTVPGGWHRYPEMAAAGLWTTPSDLARFGLAVLRAHRGEAAGPISPALARQMLTQQSGDPGGGFGLGLQVNNLGTPAERFGHSGSNQGYRAQLVIFPGTGQGMAIMTSGDQGSDLMLEIGRALAREYGWPAFQAVEKTAVAMNPAALRDVPGRYVTVYEGDTITYTVASNGSLTLQTPAWVEPRVLYPASTTEMRFFIRESGREYTFDRDASGRVVRLRVTGGGGPEIIVPRVD
jgi:CubicO group peptidase (beta-lactamase class C family)